MKKNILIIVAFIAIFTVKAQDISEVKASDKSFGMKKARKGPKKVFIKSFNINYEVYKEAIDVKVGSSGTRGKRTGDATARAAVGLDGIMMQDVQDQTDKLYQEFVSDFKAKGYEILSAEEASKIELFKDWKIASGPYVTESKLPGVLTSVPANYSFLYKDRSKVGAKLNKVFSGLNVPKISKELNDALVIDVNLYVMYSEETGKGFNLGSLNKVAKVKIKTNLRLIDQYAVVAPKAPTKLGIFGSIGVKGATTVDRINSSINVVYGKAKIGLSSLGQYMGGLKDPIEIEGVMKKDKISAYQRQQTVTPSSFGSYQNIGGLTLVSVENRFSKNATWVKVDSKKYSEGLYNACSGFLKAHTSEIFDKID